MIVTVLLSSRRVPPAVIRSYPTACTRPGKRAAERALSAAVRVVLPWSMWPMVPTLTCGLSRTNTALLMAGLLWKKGGTGEDAARPTRGAACEGIGYRRELNPHLLGANQAP